MAHTNDKYYVPHGSHWPIVGSVGLLLTMVGVSGWLNGGDISPYIFALGLLVVIGMMFGWFGNVIDESEGGIYSDQVDKSFRMGMSWFIMALPWLEGGSNNFFTGLLLWPGFEAMWPSNGPAAIGGAFQTMSAWGLPALNTAILLTSSVTITIAHHALRDDKRGMTAIFLGLTVLLGFIFVYFQGIEYIPAYQDLNLRMDSGIYGSTFFMLTGFHGMHVTIGALMLLIVWIRVMRGHFTAKHHFAFEASAWYWHFVDVVWLGLFIFVYIL